MKKYTVEQILLDQVFSSGSVTAAIWFPSVKLVAPIDVLKVFVQCIRDK